MDKLLNVDKLANKIEESGLREDFLFKSLDMTRTSWINKKKGRIPFTVPEVYMLCDLIHITDDSEKADIFYPES